MRSTSALLVGGLRQQLRGATDTRQRILDLVRQHCRNSDRRARRALMDELAVDERGHRPGLEGDAQPAGRLADRCDQHICAKARPADQMEVEVVGRERPFTALRVGEQRAERAVGTQERIPAALAQRRLRGVEQALGGNVRLRDPPGRIDDQHRGRQEAQDVGRGGRGMDRRRRGGRAHAAARNRQGA